MLTVISDVYTDQVKQAFVALVDSTSVTAVRLR